MLQHTEDTGLRRLRPKHGPTDRTLSDGQVHEQFTYRREDGALVVHLVEVVKPLQQVADGDGQRRRRKLRLLVRHHAGRVGVHRVDDGHDERLRLDRLSGHVGALLLSIPYQLNLQTQSNTRPNLLSSTPLFKGLDVHTKVPRHKGKAYTGWWFSVAVTRWSQSTQLLYIEPG